MTKTKKRKITRAFPFFLLFVSFGVFLVQWIFLVFQDYKLHCYQKQIRDLSVQLEQKRFQLGDKTELKQIEVIAQNLNFEKTTARRYLTIFGTSVFAR